MKIVTHQRHGGHFRALEIDGREVSHLGIYDYTIRIGPAKFKMGGIGGVSTHWQHRNKGYARLVAQDSIRWMKDEGYDVTMLFGIEHFYHKFGFANCMSECVAKVRTRDAQAILKARHGLRVRCGRDADWPDAARLHNKNNARRPLSLVRNARKFAGFRHGSGFHKKAEWVVFRTRAGEFAGYAILDALPEQTRTCEVEAACPETYLAVLAHLVRTAIKRRDGEIAAHLPCDHPFIAYLRRFGCVVTSTYRNTGGLMGRLINQDAVLTKLAAARVGERGVKHAGAGYVTVETGLGETRVHFAGAPRGGGGRLAMPVTTLFQILVGFRTVEETLLSPGVKASCGGEKVLEFLRSDLEPHMYSVDFF